MERTGAFDRSLLVLVSPTGLGYVNYVAMAAAQYLSRGDVASVTMQYSSRPSPLSLGRVGRAREQNRLLWLRILERLRRREGPRPRVVLFGESLGAHTSQDVFLHWGTLGLRGPGHRPGAVDRHPVRQRVDARGHRPGPPRRRPARASPSSTTSTSCSRSTQERGTRPPYVLLSHDNDGVTRFGPDLLTTAPAWLGSGPAARRARRGREPPRHPAAPALAAGDDRSSRPSSTSRTPRCPATYQAWGHDYRPDLPRFVSEVYDLPATEEQLARVADAVRQREEVRWEVFQED